MSNEQMLRAALAYAQRFGWPVFPCRARDKRPLSEHGMRDATKDPKVIALWWKTWPDANIGIPTGSASGFDVLDVDPRHGGDESLAELEGAHGKLPETVEALTGGGGRHILFKHRDGIRNSTGRHPGLDVRGEGGYIVVAPSLHESGIRYEWELSSRPGEIDIGEWPDRVLIEFSKHNGHGNGSVLAVEGDIPEGQRNATMASLAGSMRHRGMSTLAMAEALVIENQARCKPPLPDEEVRQIAASVGRYKATEDQGQTARLTDTQNADEPAVNLEALRCVADVEPEEVDWLWHPRIPLRHLTGLEGDPGEGKSFVSQAIATGLSRGHGLPDRAPAAIVNTLLLTAEDHIPTTVRPRLEAMGADLNRIFTFDEYFPLDEEGRNALEQLIKSTTAKLVVIDPIVAFLPVALDIHRANEVRTIMSGLSSLAERCDCAILIVRHLAKGNTSKAIYRGLGSIDFTAACRSVLLAGHDADDPNARGLVQIKSNLGPIADAVGYNVEQGQFSWTGATELTAGRMLAPEIENSALGEAKSLLLETLAEGPKPAKEVQDEAKATGISQATLRRAREALKVVSKKEGKIWHWGFSQDAQDAQSALRAHDEHLGENRIQ